MKLLATQWRALAITGLIATCFASAPRRPYSPHEKVFYADDATVEFVPPGLVIKITSAQIAAGEPITATVSIAKPRGLPLERTGVTTPGAVLTV